MFSSTKRKISWLCFGGLLSALYGFSLVMLWKNHGKFDITFEHHLSQKINFHRSTEKADNADKDHHYWTDVPEKRLLVVVPGHGNPERLPMMVHSLSKLKASAESAVPAIGFQCSVYVWNKDVLETTKTTLLKLCNVEFSTGLWTNHMLQVKNQDEGNNLAATHVAVLMDDLDTRMINLDHFLATMTDADFDVASPAVPDWQTASSLPRENCMAHNTGHVDVLFTIFTARMWSCWQDHINLEVNQYGWGYDLTMADMCGATVGVIDHEVAFHRPACPNNTDVCAIRTYDEGPAREQMDNWIMKFRNFKTREEADEYFHYVAFGREHEMPYCHRVKFQLGNDRFHKTTTHRGGWNAVITGLRQQETVSLNSSPIQFSSHNHSGSLLLVDCIEEWFLWEKRGAIKEPWVGFAHLLMKQDLPPHLSSEDSLEVLDKYFESEPFQQSVENLYGLMLFSDAMAEQVSEKLVSLNITNVNTCVTLHPISVEEGARRFDPSSDLEAALSDQSSVILLGQQYRRVATLHRLQTSRSKIWLPSRVDEPFISNKIKVELEAEGVAIDEKVKVMRVEEYGSYDSIVLTNIVIVDFWAAGANNSVLEAIALSAPFFIRKLAGPIDYLGEKYPLFFSSIEELQSMFNDEALLRKKMMDAHVYLKNMNKAKLSIKAFGEEMQKCALKGMAGRGKPTNLVTAQ